MKFKHYSCLLAIAAVLAVTAITTLTACSSENDLTETSNGAQPQTPTTNGVQVTVGAGLADDASTRSTVENDGTKRTLKFTTGDRLYVYGEIDANTSVAGYLTMAGSPTNDDKSATFTGAVKAYDISGATPVEKAMPAGDDPLALCTHKATKATLVHQNLNTNAISITLGANVELYTAYMSAADVNTLMTTSLPVQGDYASASKSFTLSSDSPIINCTLSGFEANSSHEVGLYYETSSVWIQSFRSTFTADANGVISVAFVSQHSGSENWKMTIGFPSDNYDIDLGTKDLTAKVYNLIRHWNGMLFVNPSTTGYENGHEYVDLGLPSGLKWATINVGATTLGDYGNYYAWGETKGYGEADESNLNNYNYNTPNSYVKTVYNWNTYKWCGGDYNKLTKYCDDASLGTVDNKTTLDAADDAATQNWGGTWRMPTQSDIVELINNCYWVWSNNYIGTDKTGYIVYKAKSAEDKGVLVRKNGEHASLNNYSLSDPHIFLPTAGYYSADYFRLVGSYGYYWSSTVYKTDSNNGCYLAYGFSFYEADRNNSGGIFFRCGAQSVRAVCP